MNNKCKSGGVLAGMGMPAHTRKVTFYTVCVAVRLLIAGAVLKLGTNNDTKSKCALAVGTLALVAVVWNLSANARSNNANNGCSGSGGGGVWWDRTAHALIALALVLTCIFVIYDIFPGWTMAAVLVGDVTFGVVTSIVKRPFDNAHV